MDNDTAPASFSKLLNGKHVVFLAIGVLLYWCLGRLARVYQYALTGAIFELLWLPMLLLLVVLPVISFMGLWKEKFNKRSPYMYALLINSATILLLVFYK
jgi:hypothetical protein